VSKRTRKDKSVEAVFDEKARRWAVVIAAAGGWLTTTMPRLLPQQGILDRLPQAKEAAAEGAAAIFWLM
jgi:hypothetical protein